MKKIISTVLTSVLILAFSLTTLAAPAINKIFVDENGDIYCFGTFDYQAQNAGVALTTENGTEYYPIHSANFYKCDTYGRKFGICLKDPNGILDANEMFTLRAWEIDRHGGDVFGEEINIDPKNNPATVVERDVLLNSISVAGTSIENFSNDITTYTVSLPAGYLTYPEIICETNKKATETEITYSDFNGEAPAATITVRNGDLTPAVFTINFEKTAAVVSDAKVNIDNIKNTTGVELAASYAVVSTDTLKAEGTAVWRLGGANDVYTSVPSELIGGTVAQAYKYLKDKLPANYDYASYGDMMEFKVNHTADVYVHIDNAGSFPWLKNNGFAESDVEVTRAGRTVKMYKKTVVVEPGTTETVSLGYYKGTTDTPSVIVKFRDTLPEASAMIENAKAYKVSDNSYKRDIDVLKNISQFTFKDSTLEGTDLYAGSNLLGAVKPFIGRDFYLYNSPMLNGSDVLKLGYTWADTTGSSTEPYYVTFDLTESATVYVHLWNFPGNRDVLYEANPWLSGYEWIYEDEGFEVGYVNNGVLSTKKYGFTKTFEVEKGKEVKTITVGPFKNPTNPTDQYTHPFVFVKPVN